MIFKWVVKQNEQPQVWTWLILYPTLKQHTYLAVRVAEQVGWGVSGPALQGGLGQHLEEPQGQEGLLGPLVGELEQIIVGW